MATTTSLPEVLVPCPVCGTRFVWPPVAACTTCRADLAGDTAAAYWQLAREEDVLRRRQARLLQELRATATPPAVPTVTTAPVAQRHRRHLTDLGAQTLLGLAGAALLAVAGLVFAAVTWQDLPDLARAAVLVGAAGIAFALARWLEGRSLHVTAGAMGLVADAFAGTVVWAAHSYGATGRLVDTGGGALAAIGALVVALALGRQHVPWQRSAATGAWQLAVLLGVLAVLEVTSDPVLPVVLLGAAAAAGIPARLIPATTLHREGFLAAGAAWLAATSVAAAQVLAFTDGAAVAWPLLSGLGAAVIWRRAAGRLVGTGAATATVSLLAVGGLATLDLHEATFMASIAAVALAVVAAAMLAGDRRAAVLIGSVPVTTPALASTMALVAVTAAAWIRDVRAVWGPPPPLPEGLDGWMAATVLLTVTGVVVVTAGLRPSAWRTVAMVVVPVGILVAALQLDSDTIVLALVAGVAAAAGFSGADRASNRFTFAGFAIVALGWAAPSMLAMAIAATLIVLFALAAGTAPVGRRPEQAALAIGTAGVAGATWARWMVTEADWTVGTAAVLAAAAIGLAGRGVGMHAIVTAVAATIVGVAATLFTGAAIGLADAAAVTGIGAASATALALAWRRDVTAVRVLAGAALLAASTTSWLLLAVADVTTVEAWSAVPAALTLLGGTVWMARDPSVRSGPALHPGLVLAVTPTLVMLVADPQDTVRALVAGTLAAILLLVGVFGRIAAPIWYGTAAASVAVLTQLVVVSDHVPRWVTFAVLGAILVWTSATFERQRLRVRATRAGIARITADYR